MTLGLSKSSDLSVIQCNHNTREKKRKFDELMTENKVSINCESSSKLSKRSYDIERFVGNNASLESPAKKSRISNIMSGNSDLNPNKEHNQSIIRSLFNSFCAKIGLNKTVTSVSHNNRNSNSLNDRRNKNAISLRNSTEISDNNSSLEFNIDNDCTKKISNNANIEQNSALVSQQNLQTSVIKQRFDEFSRHKQNKHNKHNKHHSKPYNYMNIMSYNPSSRLSSYKNIQLFKRYKNSYPYRQEDKEKYRMLINSHLSPNFSSTNAVISNKFQTQPLIDLTSSTNTSRRSSLQKDSLIINTKIASNLTNSGVHTQKLDDNCRNTLIESIKSKGIVTQEPPNDNKQSSITKHPFTPISFNPQLRKYQPLYTSTPNNANLSANVNNTREVIPKLPESSDVFKNLMKEKKNIFDESFVSDMRNSLKSSNDSNDRKILDCERKLNLCSIKRQTDRQNLESYIKPAFVRSELIPYIPFFELVEEEEENEEEQEEEIDDEEEILSKDLPPLTPEMEQMIDDALRPTPPGEVLAEAFSITVKRKDMETLSGLNWLNDEIINYYMSLIVERSKLDNFSSAYAFNTFFYPKLREGGHKVLKRWTRKVDIFSFNLIFIPVHLGMHWCLAVIDFTRKKIQYYDSMGGKNYECLNALKQYLEEESSDKKKKDYDMTDWSLEVVKDIPQQENGSDCGMFTCKYAEYISRNSRLNFSQAHMPYFRRRMVYEILSKRLL